MKHSPLNSLSLSLLTVASALVMSSSPVHSATEEQIRAQSDSRRLYMRVTGLIPPVEIHRQMYQDFLNNRPDLAAMRAIHSDDFGFYRNTVKAIFNPIFTIERDPSLALNEGTATIAGLIRNNEDFRQVLGDALYTAEDSLMQFYINFNHDDDDSTPDLTESVNVIGGVANPLFSRRQRANQVDAKFADGSDMPNNLWVTPLLSTNDGNPVNPDYPVWRYRDANDRNLHYRHLEDRFSNWPARIQKRRLSEVYQLLGRNSGDVQRVAAQDVMGVATMPTMGRAAFEAGTNRRLFKMAMYGFMCKDMEEIKDASAPDFRVRRDVTRDASYQTCRSCHAQMDGAVGAFSAFHFNTGDQSELRHYPSSLLSAITDGEINGTQNQNDPRKIRRQFNNFEAGHNPVNNTFFNFMTGGPNASLGFRTLPSGKSIEQGTGAAHLGEIWANTEQFSTCMAQRVYQRVCLHNLESEPDQQTKNEIIAKLSEIARNFESGVSEYASWGAQNPYNFKTLVAQVSGACFGQ